MRYFFAQVKNYLPKELPVAMHRGLDGHEMFEIFFKTMQAGGSYEESVTSLDEIVTRLTSESNFESLKAYRYVLAFGARAYQEGWIPFSVEEHMSYPIGDDEYVYTPDIVFRWTSGVHRGDLFMLDYKFSAQAWTINELNVYQQGPKYVRYWNLVHGPDEQIRHFGLVNLLTSAAQGATGERLYKINWVPLDKAKLDRIQFENENMVERVATLKRKNGEDQANYMRTVNSFSCKRCFFAGDLCPVSLKGKPIDAYIEKNYRVNDYFKTNYGEQTK
jgi:hypothetical protein